MPTWFGPTQSGAAFAQGEGTPVAKRLMRHFGTVVQGVNVYLLTDGTATLAQPWDSGTVARVLHGGHVEEVTDAEAALLTTAGYGAYLS